MLCNVWTGFSMGGHGAKSTTSSMSSGRHSEHRHSGVPGSDTTEVGSFIVRV